MKTVKVTSLQQLGGIHASTKIFISLESTPSPNRHCYSVFICVCVCRIPPSKDTAQVTTPQQPGGIHGGFLDIMRSRMATPPKRSDGTSSPQSLEARCTCQAREGMRALLFLSRKFDGEAGPSSATLHSISDVPEQAREGSTSKSQSRVFHRVFAMLEVPRRTIQTH
jgi:hypothetical protein